MTRTTRNLYAERQGTNRTRHFVFGEDFITVYDNVWYDYKDEARNYGTRRWLGPFTDTLTGDAIDVRPAPCGSGCYCAAEYRPHRQSSAQRTRSLTNTERAVLLDMIREDVSK